MSVFCKKSRHKARLSAVQALYQMDLTEKKSKLAILEFEEYWHAPNDEDGKKFFEMLVLGVVEKQDIIDAAIRSKLSSNWKLSRIDTILRAILRAGAYEILYVSDVPALVVINEYITLTKDFYAGQEHDFVNAALDNLARQARAVEFGIIGG